MTIELICGDCRDILPTLGKVDAVITDPPYGAGYAANSIVGKGKARSNHEAQTWDDVPVESLNRILNYAGVQCVWGGNYYALPPSRGWLVWLKPDAPPSMATLEMAWTNQNMNARHIACTIASVNAERIGHPTQKPLSVMRWCVELLTKPGETVLDPFMGTGTTGVACKALGRNFIGIDIEPKYVEIARRRINATTGPLFKEAQRTEQTVMV